MHTVKRRSQASGLQVYALASDAERSTMHALKAVSIP